MSPRVRHWLLLALDALFSGGIVVAAGLAIQGGLLFWLGLAAAILGITVIQALFWLVFDLSWLGPSRSLARELDLVLHANPELPVKAPAGHGLGPLADAVERAAAGLQRLRRQRDLEVGQAVQRANEQRSRLEAILRDLSDGIIGCASSRRILLFNEEARRILGAGPELGLDRPLDGLIAREPIAQAFDLLCERHGADLDLRPGARREEFICTSAEGERLLRCRMSLITDDARIDGFVLDFTDATERLGRRAAQVVAIGQAIAQLRRPAANLMAAAEVLSGIGDLDDAARQRFADIVTREGETLTQGLDALEEASQSLQARAWPMADFYSADLVRRIRWRLDVGGSEIQLTEVGPGLWLHGDGFHLAILIERLLHALSTATGATRFDLEVCRGSRRVDVDLVFDGEPLGHGDLESWLDAPVEPAEAASLGAGSLREVLERHDSEMWSQGHHHPGRALLRVPLPAPQRPQVGEIPMAAEALPPRPEFYDFDLMARSTGQARPLLDQPLGALTYVVFDTETTGLDPRGRDQIIQIAAVRIVNRRLLTGETFERLVNPGRPIPKASIRFHGITDDMVLGRPPIAVVLPQFHRFAEGAVLVAHNAAFDMAFLRKSEASAGLTFDHPVLDTLLLSAILHDHTPEHSLDAIAARFGIPLVDRHQALGDAIGTAQILLRMIDLLEANGIQTLGDALTASRRAVELRKRQAESFGLPAGGQRAIAKA